MSKVTRLFIVMGVVVGIWVSVSHWSYPTQAQRDHATCLRIAQMGDDIIKKGRVRKRAKKEKPKMTYRETMEKFVNEARNLIELKRFDVLHVFLANYGPQLIDRGIDLDRLYAENERLTAIVNLIDMAKERDELKIRVTDMEKRMAEGGMIY